MLLLGFLDPRRLSATILTSLALRLCAANPTYHEIASQSRENVALRNANALVSSNTPFADAVDLERRIPPLEPGRLVQFLREVIDLAADDETDTDDTNVWRVCLEHVSFFLFRPSNALDSIDNVAAKLDRLYDLAMATIYEIIERHDYPQDDDDNVFALRLGQVAIEWSCQHGPLCWHLLYDFCLLMKTKARQGWTGMYDGQLVNAGTGVVTAVRLTLRRGRQAANGLPIPP